VKDSGSIASWREKRSRRFFSGIGVLVVLFLAWTAWNHFLSPGAEEIPEEGISGLMEENLIGFLVVMG